MQCAFLRDNKSRCNARSLKDSEYCFRHDPKTISKAMEASKKGGANRSKSISFPERISLKTAQDLQTLMEKTINGVWQGKIPTKVGSTIGFLARCWIEVYEKTELEKRVSAMESQLNAL